MTISFKDKVAIVTGAGGGLGRCHALQFAERGAKVIVNDLGGSVDGSGGSSEAADKVVEEIKAMGGDAISNGSSVTDKAGVKKLVDDAMASYGRIDILLNNAGVLRDKSFAKVTLDDFEFVVDVHMMGSVYCTKAVWPIMVEQKYGRIVMTSSSSGIFGNFGQSNYGSAKMGVVDEYMISHFFKRATMIGILFGNVDFHMKRYTDLTQSNIQSINEDDGINLS